MRNRKFRRIETMTQLFRRHGSRALGGGKIFPPLVEPERHWDVHRPFKRPASQKRNGRVPLSGLARYAKGGQELYDHDADPMEHTNLLALPDAHRHAERVAYFNAIIDRYHGGAAR